MTPDSTLPSSTFELTRDAHGRWAYRGADGQVHSGVQVVRAFPLTAPEHDIAIVGTNGQELAFVARIDVLAPALQAALRQALAEREFMPVIQRIRAVSTFGTPSTWQVDTDRGSTELVLKVEEDIRRLPGSARLLINSGSGVVFEISDRNRLDRPSRRFLERFL
jgi:hypothetical protein